MKTLLWGLALAALAAALAWLLHASTGTIIALAPPWRVDASLDFFLILVFLALWLAYLGGRLAQRAKDFPERVRAYRERRTDWGAQRGLVVALKALLEGRFARAERAAERAQAFPQIAGLAALLGARAAHRMQEYARRDQWLERAGGDPELATARSVVSAELWAEQRENLRVVQTVEQMQQAGARHIHALRMAAVAHLQLGHWDDALRIVRALEKHHGLPPRACAAYKTIAYRGLLRNADRAEAFSRAWAAIPAPDRRAPDLALAAAQGFNGFGMGAEAAKALQDALDSAWTESLLDEYGRCAGSDGRAALAQAEHWLSRHGPSAALLRCLGRICLREQLWGKAREYLEESSRLGPAPETALALGELADALADRDAAAEAYRDAARGFAERVPGPPAGAERLFRREPGL